VLIGGVKGKSGFVFKTFLDGANTSFMLQLSAVVMRVWGKTKCVLEWQEQLALLL
jgi:hypothetical protein